MVYINFDCNFVSGSGIFILEEICVFFELEKIWKSFVIRGCLDWGICGLVIRVVFRECLYIDNVWNCVIIDVE